MVFAAGDEAFAASAARIAAAPLAGKVAHHRGEPAPEAALAQSAMRRVLEGRHPRALYEVIGRAVVADQAARQVDHPVELSEEFLLADGALGVLHAQRMPRAGEV